MEDFDLDYMHKLIDDALADRDASVAKSSNDLSINPDLVFPPELSTAFSLLWDNLSFELGNEKAWLVLSPVIDKILEERIPTNLVALHTSVKNCKRCSGVIGLPQLPVGNLKDPDLVVVWPIPPVMSQASEKTFYDILLEVGFETSKIAFTSIIRCDTKSKETPSFEEINNCYNYLLYELGLFSPRIVLLMGSKVFSSFFPNLKFQESCGKVLWLSTTAFMPIPSFMWIEKANQHQQLVTNLTSAWSFCYKNK